MRVSSKNIVVVAALAALCVCASADVQAQTGVSDSRVSLPEGPGSLEGAGENLAVDPNMGSMRYGVSIVLPPGFAAVTPNLSLNYDSGGGSSVVGMGWSMMTPSIERMTYRGLPEYDTEDDFAANGSSQLVRMPGTNPPVYRARYEGGFVRYTWLERGAGGEGYWLVEHPDGSKGYFGADAQGNLVAEARVSGDQGTFRYHLVEKVDVHGHRMRFDYIKDGHVSLLSRVGYVFTESDEIPTYSVSMAYEDRADETGSETISDAKAGFNELLTQRLTHVHVLTRGRRVRSYVLSYERYADSGGMTLLRRVERLGNNQQTYPVVFDFEYAMPQDTGRPFTMDMGDLGVSFSTGRATLVDINGDGLPDVVDASNSGPHRIFYNIAQADGSALFEGDFVESAHGNGASHALGTAAVQILDVDGDGFSDLLNAATGSVLVNRGNGDWELAEPGTGTASLAAALSADFDADEGELQNLKFIDYDNDKRIDVMKSTQFETTVFRNLGEDGFEVDEGVEGLGFGFAEDGLQFADMNGDGLLDVVRVRLGFIQYRMNLGFGRWSQDVVIEGLPIEEQRQLELVELEDINGDGLADLVLVDGQVVTFALNRNGADFGPSQVLESGDVDGIIPLRDSGTTVLFADMNANGSSDIVWITAGGDVTALEMFPVRPNLMTRVTNALGQNDQVVYTTAAVQMALDGGWQTQRYKLPYAMNIVGSLIQTDPLSGNPEAVHYRYSHGYYDGLEKQFRGFADVQISSPGDDHHEDGLQRFEYEVGAEDIYRKGLQLSVTTWSDDRLLNTVATTYEDCPVAEIIDGAEYDVRYLCPTATETTTQEGQPEEEWVVTRSESTFDGYGNVTLSANHGVVSIGGQGCGSCGDRGPDDFGAPCGGQCLGDESFTETDFVPPTQTGGRWIIHAPYRTRTYGREGSDLVTEDLTYYDGEAFVGLPSGNLTLGLVSRMSRRVTADRFIDVERQRFDEHGNVVELLDPLGEPGGNVHRSTRVYDADGLRVVQAENHLEDQDGNPYTLRQEMTYNEIFDRMATATDWMVVEDGQVVSEPRRTFFEYDGFGRLISRRLPEDDGPNTEVYTYNLGSPSSQVAVGRRSESGEAVDIEAVQCMDGRGRLYQSFDMIEPGVFQASGFVVFNARSKLLRFYQPYLAAEPVCATEPPQGVNYVEMRYDAAERVVGMTHPDAEIYGTASVNRTEYLPLRKRLHDAEDLDPQSPHFGTPVTQHFDGLGRLTSVERLLEAGQEPIVARNLFDSLGRMVGYTDPKDHQKSQRYDLMGRVLEVDDPNTEGVITYEYDDASNVLRTMDERGIIVHSAYDGLNRVIENWDEDDRDGTLLTYTYDKPRQCDESLCTHGAQKIVETSYPGPDGQRGLDFYGYDLRGRMRYQSRLLAGIEFERRAQFDNASRPRSVTYPDGTMIEREFDGLNRTLSIPGFVDGITYDERGLVQTVQCADGTVTNRSYDALMRPLDTMITAPGGEVLQGFGYELGRTGRVDAVEDLAGRAEVNFDARYTYNALYRLTQADLSGGAEVLGFEVDDAGNLTQRTSTGSQPGVPVTGTMGYGQGAGPNAVTSAGGEQMDYDQAGNLVQKGALSFGWDFRGRMQATEGPDGLVQRAHYSAGQDRVARVDGNGSTSLYPFGDFIIRDGISTLYISEGGHKIARVESDALATTLLTDHTGDGQIGAGDAWQAHLGAQGSSSQALLWSSVRRLLLETGPEDGKTWLHHDHLGSLTMATSGDGSEVVVEGLRSFWPYGAVREASGFVDDFGFTGQEHDPNGLIHFLHREYDPQTGRWTSIDPAWLRAKEGSILANEQGTAGYAYVSNDPINTFDGDGLADQYVAFVAFDPNTAQNDEYLDNAIEHYKGSNRYSNDKMMSLRVDSNNGSLKNSGIISKKNNVLVLVAHAGYDSNTMGTKTEAFTAKELVQKLVDEGLGNGGDLNGLTFELHGCLTGSVCKIKDPNNKKAFMDRFIKALIKKNFTNFKVKGANGTMTGDRKVADSANAQAQSHSGSEAPWSNSKAHRTVEVTSGTFGAKKKLVSGHDGATTTVVNKQIKTNVPNK